MNEKRKKPAAKRRKEVSAIPGVEGEPEEIHERDPDSPKFVVGIGGSAGALEAFEQFFHNMPPDAGLAFILVPHLDPTHKGIMPELLQRFTSMKVTQARDGAKVRANQVYVIPPNKDLGIINGTLQLLEPTAPRGLRLPIDFFFRHLAFDLKDRSIGIILSGMGTDGTLGLRAIKEQMGMAMVQDPISAKYDGMPRSAIETGLADFVAPAEDLPSKLLGYTHHLLTTEITEPIQIEPKTSSALQKILLILRSATGNDFSLYKRNTVLRRIDRRMSVHQIKSMSNYATFLRENPNEIDLLFKELLINVTNFFRDPEAFEHLRERAIIPILRERNGKGTVRVWVPGCSSGEEVYSIAILFRECMEQDPGLTIKIQMYGTDIDQDAISTARQGIYPANIAADVSPERLQRYFTMEESNFRVRKEIREMVVFAPQNILADPPFTKLDLLSCRNLLIYLTSDVQKRLLPLFQYALNPKGYLFIGSSETVSGFNDLFTPIDRKWKLFQRRESVSALTTLPEFPAHLPAPADIRSHDQERPSPSAGITVSFQDAVQRNVIESVTPPVVIVNRKGDMLYATRKTGKYFEPPVGNASLNIFDMAREGLKIELGIAIRKATTKNTEVSTRNLLVRTNGDSEEVNLVVRPITGSESLRDLLMVIFEEVPGAKRRPLKRDNRATDSSKDLTIAELEKNLQYTKENLQTTIEEMETSQEELKSMNEELQSTNEELQSTNEELTTSKEELQSLNEELLTVNAELQAKNDELALANNDMRNLLNSTQIPTLFLDNNLRIKRYTTVATALFSLIPGDLGRPITDITSHLKYSNLIEDVRSVLDTLIFKEIQVAADDGKWYIMRIMPYRTLENLIDGAVITFVDISDLKRLEQVLEERKHLCILAELIRDSNDAIVVQDAGGIIQAWNLAATTLYGWTETEVIGRNIREFIPEKAKPDYDEIMRRILEGSPVKTFTTERITRDKKVIRVKCTVKTLEGEDNRLTSIATTEQKISSLPGKKRKGTS